MPRTLPQPDPPRHPTGNQLLLRPLPLLLPLRVQGAALQPPPSLSIPRSGLSAAHTPATAR
ncbi:hypothetical protein EGJ06_19950 [Stenotrophomonas maltophilia]|nr:hypothetical protein EGJ06_19950 [Stenotrophomonas maltophilia]